MTEVRDLQADLFDRPARLAQAAPQGLAHRDHLIDVRQEGALIGVIQTLPFQPFRFHGFDGLRRIVSFGRRYDFGAQTLRDAEPIPAWLQPLRAEAAAFAGLTDETLCQVIVTEYRPGAPIGWHRDRPVFDKVVGVSLASDCTMRFRRREGSRFVRAAVRLARRSVYLLDGEARRIWEHSIAPAQALRYSVTFRSLARGSPS